MATSDVFTKESEEMFDKCCYHCSESDIITEAKRFCVECGLNFCESCIRFHETIPSLQSHEIVELPVDGKGSENKQNQIEVLTERCSFHHGKLMDMFCKDHDEVCCGVCIAIKHRTCVNVDYVPDIAKDVRTCQELTDVKDSVTAVLGNLKLKKQKRTSNIVELEEEKDKLLDKVDAFKDDLIEQIKVIAEATKLEILSDFEDRKKVITTDVDTLDILIPAMETRLQKLTTTNAAQLFVNIKASKRAIKDEESDLTELSSSWTTRHMKYVFNESLRCTISKMKTFGTPEDDVREYEAKLYRQFNIKGNTDTSTPNITGIYPFLDGSFIIADYGNNKVKKLNCNYTVKQSISVTDPPIGICNVGSNKVAVSLYINDNKGKIQFVTVNDELRLAATINVHANCYGIHNSEGSDELFVCCTHCINVYNKRGNLLRVLKHGSNGEPLFSAIRQIFVKTSNNDIIASDSKKGLIAVDSRSKLKWSLKGQELITARAICVLPSGIILTSIDSTNKVLQVDKNGNKIGVLLEISEGLNYTRSLTFDSHNSRLIVGMISENIHVYTLSPKSP